jgi:hypothetical protein
LLECRYKYCNLIQLIGLLLRRLLYLRRKGSFHAPRLNITAPDTVPAKGRSGAETDGGQVQRQVAFGNSDR